jgi:hypothetical protein
MPFYNASYPNEEVKCTEPFPSVSFPWPIIQNFKVRKSFSDGVS